ncbi:MAG TPA: glycosyltransferase [Gammaproteobacteria bacterium]|nr:glycosyltransferase [Gammaproteobacteria bacterium]
MSSPYVFILSWQRPLYLWNCLDSLYRNTRTPCRFVLVDNASDDPLVDQVIQGFERRGMFHAVHRRTTNSPDAFDQALREHKVELGDYLAYIEGDVEVLPSTPSWLEGFLALTQKHPDLAMLGSLVDGYDFVDLDWAKQRFPELDLQQLDFLIKSKSPERRLKDIYTEELIDIITPPGRLTFLKTSFILEVGDLRDRLMSAAAKRLGYRAAIATRVRHRHLSFQNLFDYPDTDLKQRTVFFDAQQGKPRI